MFRKLLSRKRLAAVGFVAVLAVTGAAVAYFTGGSGTVTGSGTVGTTSPLNVTLGTPTFSGGLTAIYPGAGTETIPFTVTNGGNGHQLLATVTATVPADASGNAESSTGPITGCLAAWFTATPNSANPNSDLAPGGTYPGTVTLTMQNVASSQDACKSAAPEVTIAAS